MEVETEQAVAEPVSEETQGDIESPQAPSGLSDIFQNALKAKTSEPSTESGDQLGAEEAKKEPRNLEGESPDQAQARKAAEKLFAELVIGEQKVPFRSKDDWDKFLEANPKLKAGFLMQSDYTKKTTLVAEERKKLDEARTEFEKQREAEQRAWGANPPDDNSKKFFSDLWNVFQYGSPQLAERINSFAQDIALIAQGKQPTGLLLGQAGATPGQPGQGNIPDFNAPYVALKREFDEYRAQQDRERQASMKASQDALNRQAEDALSAWVSSKQKDGIQVSDDEWQAMTQLSFLADKEREITPAVWEKIYRHALTELGKMDKLAIKKAVQKSDAKEAQSTLKPSSKLSGDAKPQAKSIGDVLRQGMEELKG